MELTQPQVAIAGAGPVGLTLALDLAWRGIRVLVAEARPEGHMTTVRCNHIAARTMEVFRRLGLASEIRAAGLPGNYHQGVSYRTTTTGQEIALIRIAARDDRFTVRDDGPDAGWPTPEPPHRMNQIYLEPILARAAAVHPLIDLHYGTEVTGFVQDADAVRVDLAVPNGALQTSAAFFVGCDGGRSPTRKAIGAELHGDPVLQRVQSTYIRAPGLIDAMEEAPTWAMFSMNPRRTGNVYSIDGRERWLVHNYLREDEPEFDSVDRDACLRLILGVDDAFEYEVLANEDWIGRRLVADRMRAERVFLCGDAAHLWVPYAGFGMNAGIADAVNLSWLLAGVLDGWGGPAMLDAYASERGPITDQVSRFAMDHCIAMAKQRSAVPPGIEDANPEGEAARAAFGQICYNLNVQQYCAAGLNFGYYYDTSPLIAPDGTPPPYSMSDFTPSSVPGCRVPHFFLPDGRSLLDALGPGYTLLRLDPSADTEPLERAAGARGVPLVTIEVVPPAEVRDRFGTPLLLVRPDHHVAWRGGEQDDAGAHRIVDIIRGAA